MFLLLLSISACAAQVIDYTREDYLLINNNNVLIYEDDANLFHVTNLTNIRKIIRESKQALIKHHDQTEYPGTPYTEKHEIDFSIIETLLDQLTLTNRNKRAIETIGTIWKYIAGSPDHNDKIIIENKINDLVENNNKQFMINSKLFKLMESISKNHIDDIVTKQCKIIILELQNLVNTISLSKLGNLNPNILSLREIKNIIKHENVSLSISDLLDVSKFKIMQKQDIIVILIKYPIITLNCKLFEVRAISHIDGKIIIPNQIALCKNNYTNIKECKIELNNYYCKLDHNANCLSNLLNNQKTTCSKIKEHNPRIEVILEGSILITGEHIVDNITYYGTNLVTFENQTCIDEVIYKNPSYEIKQFLKGYSSSNYEIGQYIESLNEDLKIQNINFLNFLQQEVYDNPTYTTMFALLIVITIMILKRAYNTNQNQESQDDLMEQACLRINHAIAEEIERGRSNLN